LLLLNEASSCCHALDFTQVVFCSDYVLAVAVVVGNSARTEDVAGVFVVEAVFVFGVLPDLKITLSQGLREAVFCFLDFRVKEFALGLELLEVIEVRGSHAFVDGKAINFCCDACVHKLVREPSDPIVLTQAEQVH
jgi:hypothetical protein